MQFYLVDFHYSAGDEEGIRVRYVDIKNEIDEDYKFSYQVASLKEQNVKGFSANSGEVFWHTMLNTKFPSIPVQMSSGSDFSFALAAKGGAVGEAFSINRSSLQFSYGTALNDKTFSAFEPVGLCVITGEKGEEIFISETKKIQDKLADNLKKLRDEHKEKSKENKF